MTYTLTQCWFNLYALNSGQRLYDDWYQAFYNLLFTSLPVIVAGLLDQDVSKARLALGLCATPMHQLPRNHNNVAGEWFGPGAYFSARPLATKAPAQHVVCSREP